MEDEPSTVGDFAQENLPLKVRSIVTFEPDYDYEDEGSREDFHEGPSEKSSEKTREDGSGEGEEELYSLESEGEHLISGEESDLRDEREKDWEADLENYGDQEYEEGYSLPGVLSEVVKEISERDITIEKLKELQREANVLVIKNKFLHRRYIETMYLSLSKFSLAKFNEMTVFGDARYYTELEEYARIRDELNESETSLNGKIANLKEKRLKAEFDFEDSFDKLFLAVYELAKVNKPIKYDKKTWLEQVTKMLENQRHRVDGVARLRMIYIKLLYKLNDMRSHGLYDLGPGFSTLDYEFLLKKKDVYIEKREEQRDSIIKFNHKNLATAAIVKHVDEEAHWYNDKIKLAAERLDDLAKENKVEHSKYVKLAKVRAITFKRILKLRESAGLLGVPFLISKMEYDIVELERLTKKLNNLKKKLHLSGARPTISTHRQFF